ncbi:AAA family ATPase [Clostridium paraputrificum]|uniref:AAA family ATPase n=1 Tax=Clostridium paraputrificum TaxID=29363 RepID=UPI003D331BCB
MIIKELRIDSFGGIENKVITFEKGLNIIYGENEKGKSTIEGFIKSMLYGLPQKRGKGEGDRKRYLPFKGGSIKGTILIEHKGREYILQRTFGTTKKEDSSIVVDGLTGEEVNDINLDEPGKSFLGINRSTFEKTLFIGQLAVAFTKDKEEEIMDRITTLFGCGEDEIPAARALEKLEAIKKEFTTTRGVGSLDILKKKYSDLLEERYEGYNLAEKNLQWENDLLLEREKRDTLREEISKLEVYKKYLKRINLQKEYKDITNYLRKSEELKRREKEIQNDLGGDIIDENFIDSLKEDNRIYLNFLDRSEELKEELEDYEKKLKLLEREIEDYKFINLFGDDIKDKLIALKYEQQTLGEKLEYMNKINSSISQEEDELARRGELLGNVVLVKDMKDEIEGDFRTYEEALREIKFIVEKNKIDKNLDYKIKKEKTNRIISFVVIAIGSGLSFLGLPILIVGLLLIGGGALITFKSTSALKELNDKSKAKEEIDRLNKDISVIEERLNEYMMKLKAKDFSELMSLLKKYSLYKDYEDRAILRIEEKKKMINVDGYDSIKSKFKKNLEMINSLKNVSGCINVDEVLEKISIYEKLSRDINALESEVESKRKSFIVLEEEIADREGKLKKKLEVMDLDLGNLLDIEVYIKEYKGKLKKRDEVQKNLIAMEETYKALLKDRDIDAIKEELKDIINEDNQYSYQSEDEIEIEEKKKSSELIECEKNIKDLENNISTRMIGKRSIVAIEEDIQDVEGDIKKGEKKVKALEIALGTLKDSFGEIRREVGPAINSKIADNFKGLTNGKYEEVKLADNYEMMVRDSSNLFKGTYLSSGAWDQLYLSLRLAFVELLFEGEECPIILDDAFVQYDDVRREKALLLIEDKLKGQGLIFTCQKREQDILAEKGIEANLIYL